MNAPKGQRERGAAAGGGADAEALRLLARRPMTESELRRSLEDRGHAADAVRGAVGRLRSAGYLDDLELAVDFIVTRAARLGHGPQRLSLDLQRRGVAAEVAQRAWELAQVREGLRPVELVRRQIRSRLTRCGGRLDARSYRRVYNALLRAGHDVQTVESELQPFAPDLDDTL